MPPKLDAWMWVYMPRGKSCRLAKNNDDTVNVQMRQLVTYLVVQRLLHMLCPNITGL